MPRPKKLLRPRVQKKPRKPELKNLQPRKKVNKLYEYKAKVIKVVDGDTIDAMIDLGFNTWIKKRVRLAGINAYEVRTRNKEEKKKGLEAKARVIEVLERNNNEIILTSLGVGKYGRCLGEIKFTKSYIKSNKYHGKSLNIMLVKEGHANEYKE